MGNTELQCPFCCCDETQYFKFPLVSSTETLNWMSHCFSIGILQYWKIGRLATWPQWNTVFSIEYPWLLKHWIDSCFLVLMKHCIFIKFPLVFNELQHFPFVSAWNTEILTWFRLWIPWLSTVHNYSLKVLLVHLAIMFTIILCLRCCCRVMGCILFLQLSMKSYRIVN